MRAASSFVCFCLLACSTTYRLAPADIERLKQGHQVSDLRDEEGASVDVSSYYFDYKLPDKKAAQRLSGIEALNMSLEARQLDLAQDVTAVPGPGDKWWQRTLLGSSVGLLAGFGIGYAITNRVALERVAQQGPSCHDCSFGLVMLGASISAVLGAAAGGLVAYFAGSGLGETQTGSLVFLDDPVIAPASTPAEAPSN